MLDLNHRGTSRLYYHCVERSSGSRAREGQPRPQRAGRIGPPNHAPLSTLLYYRTRSGITHCLVRGPGISGVFGVAAYGPFIEEPELEARSPRPSGPGMGGSRHPGDASPPGCSFIFLIFFDVVWAQDVAVEYGDLGVRLTARRPNFASEPVVMRGLPDYSKSEPTLERPHAHPHRSWLVRAHLRISGFRGSRHDGSSKSRNRSAARSCAGRESRRRAGCGKSARPVR